MTLNRPLVDYDTCMIRVDSTDRMYRYVYETPYTHTHTHTHTYIYIYMYVYPLRGIYIETV
jgi:hypothetical protein